MANHFNVMLKRRLREETDEDETPGERTRSQGTVGNLSIRDPEEDQEMSSNSSSSSVGDSSKSRRRPDLTLTSVS